MEKKSDYIEINKNSWNVRTEHHIKSEFYDVEGFINGKEVLNSIELELLGDVKNKNILHLQCHFGQDSLALARLGANVTGVDFSEKAIDAAKELNSRLGLNTEFICSDVYNLPNILNKKYDIVFTSYGVLGWLPDMDTWAKSIQHFLIDGGKLLLVEFHPVVWMFNDNFTEISYNYFKDEPIVENANGTYAQTDAPITTKTVSWNHSLGEVLSAILSNNLRIEHFREYDYSPYNCFSNTEETGNNMYRIKHLGNRIPMVFSVLAEKAKN